MCVVALLCCATCIAHFARLSLAHTDINSLFSLSPADKILLMKDGGEEREEEGEGRGRGRGRWAIGKNRRDGGGCLLVVTYDCDVH